VISHRNAPKVFLPDEARSFVDPAVGEPIQPFHDDRIHYHGQPIAVVVADTFEQATHAASLGRGTYKEEKAVRDFASAAAKAFPPSPPKKKGSEKKPSDYKRGNPDKVLAEAEVSIEQTYTIPDEHHNPMELHTTVAAWDDGKLTLYDKTQWVDNVQNQVAVAFGIPKEDVHVVSPFVGGAFGSALRAWVHTFIAALAARAVRRPVKLVLSRAQEYTVPGYRPHAVQKIALGATKEGKLTVIRQGGDPADLDSRGIHGEAAEPAAISVRLPEREYETASGCGTFQHVRVNAWSGCLSAGVCPR
jgi:xanthine dehydrogenase YagR molybdenum-binding subunit